MLSGHFEKNDYRKSSEYSNSLTLGWSSRVDDGKKTISKRIFFHFLARWSKYQRGATDIHYCQMSTTEYLKRLRDIELSYEKYSNIIVNYSILQRTISEFFWDRRSRWQSFKSWVRARDVIWARVNKETLTYLQYIWILLTLTFR